MYPSQPNTPFIPPLPGALPSPAGNAAVIPPSPQNWPPGLSPVAPAAAAAPPAPPPPGTPYPSYGVGTPYPSRGRRNSYHGTPPGPPFNSAAYYGYPTAPMYPTATPAAALHSLGFDRYGRPMAQDQYLHANYGAGPTPVIPPRPSPSRSHSRSRSRGSNNGFPPDWAGPTRPGDPVPQPIPVPPEFAAHVPPGTPWYLPPGVHPGTGYSAFQHPLPPVSPGYSPRPSSHHRRPSHSHHTTPWMGWGYLPPTPGADDGSGFGDAYERAARPEYGSGMVDTRWFSGKDYGPVLDPVFAGIVRCTFKVNPLLSPPPDDPAQRPYLTWNMLFNSTYVHRSDEAATQSWMKGRDAPATFPRLSALRIISKTFPWFIDINAHSRSRGVTCGDVVDTLASFLHERTSRKDFEALPKDAQTRVSLAYHHNRSMADDVPGGRLGEGLRRCDFFGEDTMWGGLEVDLRYVAERMGIHGRAKRDPNNVFVLNCEKRLPMREDERREQAMRGRSASRSRAATASTSD